MFYVYGVGKISAGMPKVFGDGFHADPFVSQDGGIGIAQFPPVNFGKPVLL